MYLLIRELIPMVLTVLCIIAVLYFLFFRQWFLKLGVRKKELSLVLPGDKLVVSPNMRYMQAITINAPSEIIWKYLIQVGYKRAGWYNLDFINRMTADNYFYENNKSADRIIPELQDLKEGDKIYLNPGLGMNVSSVKKDDLLLLTGYEDGKYVASWVYKLKKVDRDTTRMLVRWNSNQGDNIFFKLLNLLVMEPASAIQQAKMLKGIKERAERELVSKNKSGG